MACRMLLSNFKQRYTDTNATEIKNKSSDILDMLDSARMIPFGVIPKREVYWIAYGTGFVRLRRKYICHTARLK